MSLWHVFYLHSIKTRAMKLRNGVNALLALVISCTACNSKKEVPAVINMEAKVMMDVAYGSNPKQKMDVYLPANRTDQTPVIVFLHGGGFAAGDKNEFSAFSQQVSARGNIVLNVNYRLVDTTGLLISPPVHKASAVRIKEQLQDVDAALSFAATQTQAWNMTTGKWNIAGHSAGATLALLAGYNSANAGRLKAVANLAGATDLSFADESQFQGLDPRLVELYYRAVGAEPKNPNKLAYMAVSPYWVANTGTAIATINIRPEFNVVFNLDDASKPLYQSFTQLLTNKGVTNKWVEVTGADHGFGQPGNWDLVVNEMLGFFAAVK